MLVFVSKGQLFFTEQGEEVQREGGRERGEEAGKDVFLFPNSLGM